MEAAFSRIRPARRIHLLWLIDSLTVGGAERLVSSFAGRVDRDRFELQVACLKEIGGNPLAAELESMGQPVTLLDARHLRDFSAFRRLLRLVREQQVDLIHAHLTYADIWGRWAGLLTGRPVVSTVHSPVFFNYLQPRRRDRVIDLIANLTRRYLGGAVITVSDALKREFIDRGLPRQRMTTLHNGIEPSKFRPAPLLLRNAKRAELGIPANAPVVITVAVLREGKGYQQLLASIPRVLAKVPAVKFLIVGGGPLEGKLHEQVRSCGLHESVLFTGTRQDIAEMLAAADLFVLPSERDPLPTAIVEAMAMRLPVVAVASGGVPEIVVHGETGLLVPSAAPEVLSNQILKLVTNSYLAAQMGERGRARFEAEFSAPAWVRKLEQLYEQILSPRRRRRQVCVVEFWGHGGLIHYSYQLCRALARQGLDVELLTTQSYELAELPHNFPVKRILRLWNPRPAGALEMQPRRAWSSRLLRRIRRGVVYYREWWRLIRYLRRERPEVVQFGDIRFITDLFPLLLLRLSGLRLTDIWHNAAPFDLRPGCSSLVKCSSFHRLFYGWISDCFSAIFLHSEANRQEFVRLYGRESEKLHVIPHGTEELFLERSCSSADQRDLRSALNLPEDAPVVLFFGTLTKYKGLESLLDAFARTRRVVPSARLLIAGYPNPDVDVDALRRQAQRLGIGDAVVFYLQYIPSEEVAGFFKLADVTVFPYLMIYQSGALQVACTFRKPIVATRVGGLPEVVKDGETGLLVPPRDPEALAEALIKLLSNRELAASMGQRAQELTQTRHSWDLIARRMAEVYPAIGAGRIFKQAQS